MIMLRPENILFLSVEDLNDFVTPLGGHPDAVTPNIQRLADRGVLFTNAMSTSPACSPARTAALFGQAPWRTGIYFNANKHWHKYGRNTARSLPGYLRKNGWKTYGAGKIFHGPYDQLDMTDWTQFDYTKEKPVGAISKAAQQGLITKNMDFGPLPRGTRIWDDERLDFTLGKITSNATGCFWSFGVYRPHLPFVVAEEYFDPIPEDPQNPPGMVVAKYGDTDPSNIALHDAPKELMRRSAFNGKKLLQTGEFKAYLRAYLASCFYADTLIGRVLDHLDATGQAERTLIVLWSDHGQQFGEKGGLRKFTLSERSLRIPMIFSGPGIQPSRVKEPVSLLDMYPTVMSVLGLEAPDAMDGSDLSGLIYGLSDLPRDHVLSIWGREDGADFSPALSVRTKDHRYSFYWNGDEELYNHTRDPYELKNLASDNAHAETLERLMSLLPIDIAPPHSTSAEPSSGSAF
ncbi:MAG: sulfatase-like hydrolase/transferase [Pseudomonadota bacterium]